MILSERLRHIAGMVTQGNRLADIGTDHGFVPIILIQEGRVPSAIAMDINEGPLERAAWHIRMAGLEDRISLRLSDGLDALNPGEADTVLIAGMGGALTVRILNRGLKHLGYPCHKEPSSEDQSDNNVPGNDAGCITELVLQPQSEVLKVRRFLEEYSWNIIDEDMVLEAGKFYPMIKCRPGHMKLTEEEAAFGPVLLGKKHPVLREYLLWQESVCEKITESLKESGTPGAREKMPEFTGQMDKLRALLDGWK